jgi:hypothetical protein
MNPAVVVSDTEPQSIEKQRGKAVPNQSLETDSASLRAESAQFGRWDRLSQTCHSGRNEFAHCHVAQVSAGQTHMPTWHDPNHQPVFQGEIDPTPSRDTQVFLHSGVWVQGANEWIGRLAAAA